MKTFIAMNIVGGYTELWKKTTDDVEIQEVENCQVLLIDEAETIESFLNKVKETWKDFTIGQIEVREISSNAEYFDIT